MYTIDTAINDFINNINALNHSAHKIDNPCEYAYIVTPKSKSISSSSKDIDLTLMALVHGNETAGVAVLNEILELIIKGFLSPQISIAFILANPWAAKKNLRYLEKDLNRSFNTKSPKLKEELRAKNLELLLSRSSYLIDFHQTRIKSERPFFIFPYTPKSFKFAADIDNKSTIVTHSSAPFSKDGFGTDEFINLKGGTGISYELGQNGFNQFSIDSGFKAAFKAIKIIENYINDKFIKTPDFSGEIFTWEKIITFQTKTDFLVPDLYNFKFIEKDNIIGKNNNKDIITKNNCYVLFPIYPKKILESTPSELCRLLKKISPKDLSLLEKNHN